MRIRPAVCFTIRRLRGQMRQRCFTILADVLVDHDRRAGVITVVPHCRCQDLMRTRYRCCLDNHHRSDSISPVIVRHIRPVRPTRPQHMEQHLMSVSIFPAAKRDTPIVKNRWLILVFVIKRYLLDLFAIRIAPVQNPRRIVATTMTLCHFFRCGGSSVG